MNHLTRHNGAFVTAAIPFLPCIHRARIHSRLAGIVRAALLLSIVCLGTRGLAFAASNPGDPLFCQPNEGTTFLIVNGGAGVFTVDSDCYYNNLANDTETTIATSQGGVLTRVASTGDYIYTPPTPGFVGLDTFPINVTSVWNSAGGTGSDGGSARPGGPATLLVTLNVIPAASTLAVAYGTATQVPLPPGSVSGCSPVGNAGLGPVAGAVYGCTTRVFPDSVAPFHGTLSLSAMTIVYTPSANYSGPDTFTYQVVGINDDGSTALSSGTVTAQVTVGAKPASVPALGAWGLLLLCLALVLFGMKAIAFRPRSVGR